MKGVILSRCPQATVLDLTHGIAPCDITEGALFLAGAMPYFPPGTIHVVVIDPGVGTKRLPILARLGGQFVLCPDNGLLTLAERKSPIEEARAITNPAFQLDDLSSTFHGRDLFAAAAGSLAAGASPEEAGDIVDAIHRLELPQPQQVGKGRIEGEIIHVDHFGNLITNIEAPQIEGWENVIIESGTVTLSGVSRTYADTPPHTPLGLIGSFNHLEIAVNQGSAAKKLGLHKGNSVRVTGTP